jgi:succinate dehydrogenase hydrophobic anchor subunit
LLAANSNLGQVLPVALVATLLVAAISTLIHLALGVENIIYDYIHHEKTRRLSIFLNRLVQIEAFKYLYIYIIFVSASPASLP